MWWLDLQSRRQQGHAATAGQVEQSADIEPGATLDERDGPISIGGNTRVCAGAIIKGPVTIGERCMIGNYAMVRGPTVIGDQVQIGFATEIKAAVIESGVAIGPQCFVADSLIETGAYLGAQVRTSNHRLDKHNVNVIVDGKPTDSGSSKLGCRIGARSSLGIQVIILPGRDIAPDSTFAPRVTIEKNLPTGRYRLVQPIEAF